MKFRIFYIAGLIVFLSFAAFGQGITDGSISGRILDQNGQSLPGANILAIHIPSGTSYVTVSRKNGHYAFSHARIGGPYVLKASFIGYKSWQQEDIYVNLGENQQIQVVMNRVSF